MSDFRRFCIAAIVVHGILGVLAALGFGPDGDDFPKRVLISACFAALWVCLVPNKQDGRA